MVSNNSKYFHNNNQPFIVSYNAVEVSFTNLGTNLITKDGVLNVEIECLVKTYDDVNFKIAVNNRNVSINSSCSRSEFFSSQSKQLEGLQCGEFYNVSAYWIAPIGPISVSTDLINTCPLYERNGVQLQCQSNKIIIIVMY